MDPIFLHKKYIEEGLSTGQIAREIDFSKNAVRGALIKFGIPIRDQHRNHGNRNKLTYGFRKVNGKSVSTENEQKIISAIIEFREREQLSFHKIAKYLNKVGVPTKTKSKRGWVRETVRNIYKTRGCYGLTRDSLTQDLTPLVLETK